MCAPTCKHAGNSADSSAGAEGQRMTAPLDKLGAPPARLKRSQASLVGGIACGIGVAILTVLLLGGRDPGKSRDRHSGRRGARGLGASGRSLSRASLSPGEPRRALFEKRRGALAIILAVERFADQLLDLGPPGFDITGRERLQNALRAGDRQRCVRAHRRPERDRALDDFAVHDRVCEPHLARRTQHRTARCHRGCASRS